MDQLGKIRTKKSTERCEHIDIDMIVVVVVVVVVVAVVAIVLQYIRNVHPFADDQELIAKEYEDIEFMLRTLLE